MYPIGQFSRMTGLTIKAIRFYGEKGILEPSWVNDASGYRYYTDHDVEKARVITSLKAMRFSVEDIQRVLQDFRDEDKVVEFLTRKRAELLEETRRIAAAIKIIDHVIQRERVVDDVEASNHTGIVLRPLEAQQVLSIRARGRYSDGGAAFSRLGRQGGRHICGPPFSLYHDGEYKAEDADIEWCFPVRGGAPNARVLEGGKAWCAIHRGPYDTVGLTYQRLYRHLRAVHASPALPIREIYVEGPGLLFRGNPRNYVTEICILTA